MKGNLVIGVVLVIVGVIILITNPFSKSMPVTKLSLTSTAFAHNGTIPAKYTCDGDRALSPPLTITGVPEGAGSLVLVMDDPDVPKALRPDGVFDHWVAYAIPTTTTEIVEGEPLGATGLNGRGEASYTGPCPPPDYEPKEHRYIFRVYAVTGTLNFIKAPTKQEVLDAIQGSILDEAILIGRYQRQ